jgi:hypothetical protein
MFVVPMLHREWQQCEVLTVFTNRNNQARRTLGVQTYARRKPMEEHMPHEAPHIRELPVLAGAAVTFVVLAIALLAVTAVKVTSFSLDGIAAILLVAVALLFLAVAVWHPDEK